MDTRRRNLAVVLIIVGVIFLLVQMNALSFSGIGAFFGDLGRGFGEFFGNLGRSFGEFFGGFGRMIGEFFGSIPWGNIWRLWPAVLILIGLAMIVRRPSSNSEKAKHDQHEV
jgi:hypothetical protein